MKTCSHLFTALLFAFAVCVPANCNADLIINVAEIGGNVRFEYSGALDLTGMNSTTSTFGRANSSISGTPGAQSGFLNRPVAGVLRRQYALPFATEPEQWVAGPGSFRADSSGGDVFFLSNIYVASTTTSAVWLGEAQFAGGGDVWSGSGFMQFDNTTLADLTMDLSTDLVWTLNNGTDMNPADTITMTANSAAVPEPSTFALLTLGAVGFLGRRWRRG